MKVEFWVIGKTSFDFLETGNQVYLSRIKHYLSFEMLVIPDLKNRKSLSEAEIKAKEGAVLLSKINVGDGVILLDEGGKRFSSLQFAEQLEGLLQQSFKRLIFIVGGAYGFSDAVYERANRKISLSDMTFSHQLVRVIFLEQFYRALTIMNNEPYHHQ